MNSGSRASVLTCWYPAGGGPLVATALVAVAPAPRLASADRIEACSAAMSERSCSYSGGGGGAGVRAAAVASSIEARRLATSGSAGVLAGDVRAQGSDVVLGGAPAAPRAATRSQPPAGSREACSSPIPPSGFPPSLEAAARRGGNGRRSGPGTSGAPKRRAAQPPEPDSTSVYPDQGAPTSTLPRAAPLTIAPAADTGSMTQPDFRARSFP